MSRFCPRHQAWLLSDPDAPLQLWAQLASADKAGAFNTPAGQIERWHAALELTDILLASGRAEALPCLLVAEAVIRELSWQWPGLGIVAGAAQQRFANRICARRPVSLSRTRPEQLPVTNRWLELECVGLVNLIQRTQPNHGTKLVAGFVCVIRFH